METDGARGARKHVRALVVAADAHDARHWVAAAREDLGLDVRYASTVAQAARIAAERPVDVALIAVSLTDGSYRDVLRALHVVREDLAVVVIGSLDHDAIRDALALGAIDVVAPADLARLGPAVVRALRDALLGAMLRRARAEATLIHEALRRTGEDLAVVAADVDGMPVVYATRSDLVGRKLAELPFVHDGEEGDELGAAVLAMRGSRLHVAGGTLAVEPLVITGTDRHYVAVAYQRGADETPDERDPLTGLPQRHIFERRAASALADAERDGGAVAALFLDIDRFRIVNELGGHAAGDAVLREVATRLTTALPACFVARFGGDAFVVLTPEHDGGSLRAVADVAAGTFAAPFVVGGKPVHLTASIGIAIAPDDATDVPALIGTAETAVFEAKRLGRNTVRFYTSDARTSSLEHVVTRRDLQGALERDEFDLYYQPMYDIETRAIHGVEALMRWRHPEHGLVMPDRFIPIAEECGMIEELGAWVLDRAIAQVREWSDAGIPAIRVSVNVSARQFENDALPKLVATLLARYNVAASCLELEITESAIMRDVAAAVKLLRALREIGVRVSIDDFGTGYTSLGFLKRFPVDVLKIDRSFVADVADGAFDGAVIRAVTTLARGLGVRTVAEGVEVPEQFERLRALDCDVVQGFLFAQPLPADACAPLLRTAAAAAL